MQRTVEYPNNSVSAATVQLLVRERNNGKSLRQLGQMFGVSHETIRKLLARDGSPQVTLLSEGQVAAKLGYPVQWIAQLRKKGLVNPMRPGWYWLYSEEQVRQIAALIAEMRKCQRCGRPLPPGFVNFCRECSQYSRKHKYLFLSPEAKARQNERCRAWSRANPEKVKELRSRANKKYRAKRVDIGGEDK